MTILEVGLGIYPQPDGCIGYKVGIKTDEPTTLKTWLHHADGDRELILEQPVDHTWHQYGAIAPPDSEGVTLEQPVEGTIPAVAEGHDPRHGDTDPIDQRG